VIDSQGHASNFGDACIEGFCSIVLFFSWACFYIKKSSCLFSIAFFFALYFFAYWL
jgi:hypothetical protein